MALVIGWSVPNEQDPAKWQGQGQALAGVERRQQIKPPSEGGHRGELAAVVEAVGNRQEQCEVFGVEDQARSDDVAVCRVVGCSTACFDFDNYSELVMEGVDVVRDFGPAVATEQDRAPDAVSFGLAGFDGVAELFQAWCKLS